MEGFKIFQEALEDTFPSLTVFSDLDWDDVTREYIASHEQRPSSLEDFTANFPLFLQEKAEQGDCPDYLFELAYFELAQAQILSSTADFPTLPGVHLNPTATFLNLAYDINVMMDEATKGTVQVVERPHVVCLYKHPSRGFMQIELDNDEIAVLSEAESGERSQSEKIFMDLVNLGLIFTN